MSPEDGRRTRFIFDAKPDIVARRLLKARIKFGGDVAEIIETDWYTGEENRQQKAYELVTTVEPGSLVGVKYRKAILPLIATKGGGCVLIRGIELHDQEGNVSVIKGPGRVGKKLGLAHEDIRKLRVEDPHNLTFSLS